MERHKRNRKKIASKKCEAEQERAGQLIGRAKWETESSRERERYLKWAK